MSPRVFTIYWQVKANWHLARPNEKEHCLKLLRADESAWLRNLAEELDAATENMGR